MAKKKRENPEINASSMADIAFLLLIFFLVTTTVEVDKGILHKLPRWDDEPPPQTEQYKRNTMEVLINSKDLLLVNGDPADVNDLRRRAKEFLNNRGVNPELSDSPQKAVISLQNDRGTSYGIYINVQNELKAAYRELRDDYAVKNYGKTLDELKDENTKQRGIHIDKIKDVTSAYPMRLSEAEPKALGGEE